VVPFLLPFAFLLLTFQPSSPVIVKLIPPKEENLADVLVGALGVTGVMVVIALVAALVFAGVLFWVRSRD
jgi:hypothetical protein